MIDYLEQHLGNAEVLLERIRQLEQSTSRVSDVQGEHIADFSKQERYVELERGAESEKNDEVPGEEFRTSQADRITDQQSAGSELREEDQTQSDRTINRQIREENNQGPEQTEKAAKAEEAGSQTNEKRAEHRPPLSAQLEELDRAVSALTTGIPAGRETAQGSWSINGRTGSYPVALPGPQGSMVDPTITGVPGGAWSGSGTAVRADFAYGGGQSWAEQADRVFRRDSRRYDGGFYLY